MAQRRKTVKIADWAAPILRNLEVDGPRVRIRELLVRSDYLAIDKILKALGGKWDRHEQAHVFATDAQPLLDQALGDGEAVDQKRSLEQFDTPSELARRMAGLAEITEFDSILEPSAGTGSLVKAAYESVSDEVARTLTVSMVEIDPKRCEQLAATFSGRSHMVDITHDDFIDMLDENWCSTHDPFDVVLMNPPFSHNQDIRHVMTAWEYLAPKGRLVAIIAPHGFTQVDVDFGLWLNDIGAAILDLPAGTFHGSGTEIKAHLISAVKGEMAEIWSPRPARRRGRPATPVEPGPLLARMGVS